MATPQGMEIWSPQDLYRLLRDDRMDAIPSYFLDNFFTERFYSEDGEIRFAELPAADRKMAPFVLPTEQGKPLPGVEGGKLRALTPAYMKPKNAVRAVEARQPRVSEALLQRPLSLQERFNLRVLEVTQRHLRAIRMRWAHMAARSFIDAKLTVNYERDQGTAHPEVTIDFGRNPAHEVVLSGSFWDDPTYDIMGDIQEWANTMQESFMGGWPRVMLVGASVAAAIQKNENILAEIEKQRVATVAGDPDVMIRRGILDMSEPMNYIGTVGGGISIYSYKDHVENDDGSVVELLDPKEIVLIAPGATGILAFGAIYNAKAFQQGRISTDIFPSMWLTDDPSDIFLMHETAPLTVPLYPNRTFKARVLA